MKASSPLLKDSCLAGGGGGGEGAVGLATYSLTLFGMRRARLMVMNSLVPGTGFDSRGGGEMCDDLEKRERKREQNRIAQRNYRERQIIHAASPRPVELTGIRAKSKAENASTRGRRRAIG